MLRISKLSLNTGFYKNILPTKNLGNSTKKGKIWSVCQY